MHRNSFAEMNRRDVPTKGTDGLTHYRWGKMALCSSLTGKALELVFTVEEPTHVTCLLCVSWMSQTIEY